MNSEDEGGTVSETRAIGETGAGTLRNRCAFTSRDMGADWPDAFTFAVVCGWDDEDGESSAMDKVAARWGWDAAMVEFLRDAHRRFAALPDRDTLDGPS
jgi:hypothetical protein